MSAERMDTGRADPVILIVDDHDVVRHALRERIRASFPDTRCLEAQSGEEAVASTVQSVPAIVLMDIEMPGMNGLEAARQIHARHPETHIVIVSIHDLPNYRSQAEAAGAAAFISKRNMRTELMPLLMRLAHGGPDPRSVDGSS